MTRSSLYRSHILLLVTAATLSGCDTPETSEEHQYALSEEIDEAEDVEPSDTLVSRPLEESDEEDPDAVATDAQLRWTAEPGGLAMLVENVSGRRVDVEVHARADDGAAAEVNAVIADLSLAPGARQKVEVSLEDLGLATDAMIYSGKLMLYAAVGPAGAQAPRVLEFAPSLYFHPDGNDPEVLQVYDEAKFRIHAGDYAGRHVHDEPDQEEPSVVDRYIDGSHDVRTPNGTWDQARHWPWGADGPPSGVDATDFDMVSWSPPAPQSPVDELTNATTEGGLVQYTMCLHWDLQTIDSGAATGSAGPFQTALGVQEDKGRTSNNPAVTWLARGVRFRVSRPGFSRTINANTSGCGSFYDTPGNAYTLRAYGYSTDLNGNYVRIHDGPWDSTGTYPGNTYSAVKTNVTPTPWGTDHHTFGNDDPKWTTMAALGYSLYRYHNGVNDGAFHVAFDWCSDDGATGGGNCNSSSWRQAPWQNGTTGTHHIKVGYDNSSNQPRRKFLVSHELGHAVGGQYAFEHYPTFDGYSTNSGKTHSQNACGIPGGRYSIYSYEFTRHALKEAFAHFYASRIYNDWHNEGMFVWGGPYGGSLQAYDLERALGASGAGGHLEDVCCATSTSCRTGAATIGDWLTALWDWNSMEFQGYCVGDVPSRIDLMELQANTAQRFGSSQTNTWALSELAVEDMEDNGQIGSCARSRWATWGNYNGINN